MLNEEEKEEFRHLLKFLPEKELISLKDTITSKLIKTHSVEETIDAILTYTESASELLSRKKISRSCLFQYLANKKVPLPGSASKSDLVDKILHSPNSSNPEKFFQLEKVPEKVPEEQNLALQFASWFYKQINSNNPKSSQVQSEPWGPQHFWYDCKLVLTIKTSDEYRREEFIDANQVAERLLNLSKDELLIFNPNLENFGTKGKMNKHGLMMVGVCGTLHQGSNCLGIFEQNFGLIRDPAFQNNWKIKYSNLFVQSKDVKQTPRLGQESLEALDWHTNNK